MFDISNELSTKTIKRLCFYIVNHFLIKSLLKSEDELILQIEICNLIFKNKKP